MTPSGEHGEAGGDALFGLASATYGHARPDYPHALYGWLQAKGAIAPGVRMLEVGPGSGLATRRMLAYQPSMLVAVEPDRGFAAELDQLAAAYPGRMQWLNARFEDAALPAQTFDLAFAATSFHWLAPVSRVARLAVALRPGGHLALWWNVFGDPQRHDAFHEATLPVMEHLAAPSDAGEGLPFGLDEHARRQELLQHGLFEWVGTQVYRWTLHLTSAEVGALYGTFSVLLRLPAEQRLRVQQALIAIADQQFNGHVERNMCTPVYLVRRALQASARQRAHRVGQ